MKNPYLSHKEQLIEYIDAVLEYLFEQERYELVEIWVKQRNKMYNKAVICRMAAM